MVKRSNLDQTPTWKNKERKPYKKYLRNWNLQIKWTKNGNWLSRLSRHPEKEVGKLTWDPISGCPNSRSKNWLRNRRLINFPPFRYEDREAKGREFQKRQRLEQSLERENVELRFHSYIIAPLDRVLYNTFSITFFRLNLPLYWPFYPS